MSKKRHTKEARIRAIREHEAGRSQAEICRQLNITAPTFYRWKKQLGMMTNSDAQRLRTLEKDNKELKQMVCRPPAGEARPQDRARKTLSPSGPAGAHACRTLGLHRNTARYQARPRRAAPEVERALLAVFSRHPRLGQGPGQPAPDGPGAACGRPEAGPPAAPRPLPQRPAGEAAAATPRPHHRTHPHEGRLRPPCVDV